MDPPIWKKVGWDATAIMELINQGMDLTEGGSLENGTVLHYWASVHDFCPCHSKNDGSSYQEDSLGVVKLLVEKGADLLALNDWGFTPLIAAANGSYQGIPPNLKVLDYLLTREEYSRAEKIEAMELAGAVILKHIKNTYLFHKAFDYWRKAFHLRHIQAEDSSFIAKPRLNLKNVQTTEWNTLAELEDVIEHPETYTIQSFLVRLRIFSSKSSGALNCLISNDLLDNRFRELHYQYRFVEILDITWATLETLLSRFDLGANKITQWTTAKVVELLVDVLLRLDRDSPDLWTEEIIKTSLDLIESATELRLHCNVLCPLIKFVRNLSHLPQFLRNKGTFESLSKVRNGRGGNLLHEAIVDVETSCANLHATVRLLFYAGCDPNAIDNNGNAPLHCLVQLDRRCWKDDLNTIAVLLLDFGAQLSRKNADGKTAIDLLIQKNGDKGITGWKLPEWCTELPTLQCLSARVIRHSRIPHLELPATLIPMIEKHKIIQ